MLTFHWSTLGRRLSNGRAREKTWSGTNGRPLTPTHDVFVPEGSVTRLQLLSSLDAGTKTGGPAERLNTDPPLLAFNCCAPRTGRFCVMAWPNIEPNTPMS